MKRFLFLCASLCLFMTARAEQAPITITILVDNYAGEKGLKAEWGFSSLIEGTETPILFDTGRGKDVFYSNIEQLKLNLADVGQLVISHNHKDHAGNLDDFVKAHPKTKVYLPSSYSDNNLSKIPQATIVNNKPIEISKDVYLTGSMSSEFRGKDIVEQALIINTAKGLVIITGCAHPGIINIVKKAKKVVEKDVYLVLGGFHLMNNSDNEIRAVISQFKELGVLKVGATHCTGDRAIELFKQAYGKHYIQMGTGKVVEVPNQI